jgi:hypothetical protein
MEAWIEELAERHNIALSDPEFMRKIWYVRSAELEYNSRMHTESAEIEEGLSEGFAKICATDREKAIRYAAILHSPTFDWDLVRKSFPDLTDAEIDRAREMAQEIEQHRRQRRAEDREITLRAAATLYSAGHGWDKICTVFPNFTVSEFVRVREMAREMSTPPLCSREPPKREDVVGKG